MARDHPVAALQQPVVAVGGIPGESGREVEAGGALLLQRAVRFAAMHHHLVLHHHAAVVDRRHQALRGPQRPVGPVGEAAVRIQREPGDDLRRLDQVVPEQARLAHHAAQPGRRVLVADAAEARRIEVPRVRVAAGAVDVEQHHLRLGVFRAPVRFRELEELRVVEAVVDLGMEQGRVVRVEAAERRRQEHVQRGRNSFGHPAGHRGDQFLGRGEMLRDDQLPRPLLPHHVEQALALLVGVDILQHARRRHRAQQVREFLPAGFGQHGVLPVWRWTFRRRGAHGGSGAGALAGIFCLGIKYWFTAGSVSICTT